MMLKILFSIALFFFVPMLVSGKGKTLTNEDFEEIKEGNRRLYRDAAQPQIDALSKMQAQMDVINTSHAVLTERINYLWFGVGGIILMLAPTFLKGLMEFKKNGNKKSE